MSSRTEVGFSQHFLQDFDFEIGPRQVLVKLRNTFLQVPALFPFVIRDRDFEDILHNQHFARSHSQRVLERLFWFWPRIIDAAGWSHGAEGLLRSPFDFVDLDFISEHVIKGVQAHAPDLDAKILDIGCNSGRHLNALYQAGYRNLTGVDAMSSALDVFREKFPDAASCANLSHDLFQRFLAHQPGLSYDVTFSHGATLELVHPSFDVVRHVCRITKGYIVLYIYEHAHAYPRMWLHEFRKHGFDLTAGERPLTDFPARNGSLLILRRVKRDR